MREKLLSEYQTIRQTTEVLSQGLNIEDYGIQGMPDVSPPKWHLAHTAWFFETFILQAGWLSTYQAFDTNFYYLFNSYYQGIGEPYPRAKRGLLSRPSVQKVYEYRQFVDSHMLRLIKNTAKDQFAALSELIYLGLAHEQQHQELMLMDIKYNFSLNPDFPSYHKAETISAETTALSNLPEFISLEGSIAEIGSSEDAFCFDNELPLHSKIIPHFSIAKTLVTNFAFMQFIDAGGYSNPALWLADGWDWVLQQQIKAPLYWYKRDGKWMQFTLSGLKPLELAEPLCHVSYFEADAFARYAGFRLPFEEEWEYAVKKLGLVQASGNYMESKAYHPKIAHAADRGQQFLGDVWEWTASSYSPYPGYKPLKGILGEYNGKFMSNQMVLRGGSCVTPTRHIRASYRNFYQADKRWPFCGIRLAHDN